MAQIQWVIKYWRIIVIIISAGGAFYLGWASGHDSAQDACQRQIRKYEDGLYAQYQAALDDAMRKSEGLEKTLKVQRDEFRTLERRLENEINSSVYRGCVIPDGGVQLYEAARTAARGAAAR